MMFCQVDVTNRYGVDPVSTRLTNNILNYMAAVAPPDPGISSLTDIVREGLDDSPVPVKMEKRVFMVDKPAGQISWGISAADLYFEGFLDLPLIQGENGRKYLYCQPKGQKTYAHTLNRKNFKTKWQQMKTMFIKAALLINQGGSSETFPNPSLQANVEDLYPIDWLEGFVHPYLIMQW